MPDKPKQRIELDPQLNPWEMQFDETAKQYAAFAIYRDLGPERSLPKVAQALSISVGAVQQWSSPNRWVERAEAYDVYIDRRLREQRETEILRMGRSETQLGRTMVSAALRRFVGFEDKDDPAKSVEAIDLNKVTAGEAVLMAREGVRISRVSTGRPTELIKGALLISAAEYQSDMQELVEILFAYVPEELKPAAAEEVRAFAAGEKQRAISG